MSTSSIHIDRLLAPFADCLSPEMAARIVELRADEAMQIRIDYLADRANEGALTAEERDEYDAYLQTIDVLAVMQAKARAVLRRAS